VVSGNISLRHGNSGRSTVTCWTPWAAPHSPVCRPQRSQVRDLLP
jgi:hypothetical protein